MNSSNAGTAAPDGAPGVVVDIDGALGTSALHHPLKTLWSRVGPRRDQRSVMGLAGLVRLIVTEHPDARVVYLTSAPPLLHSAVDRALHMDGYPPGSLRAPSHARVLRRGGGASHKRDVLRRLLAEEDRRWILLGDDGGPDPALFSHAGVHGDVEIIALWHLGRPDRRDIRRLRERVGQVPVLDAITWEELAGELATRLDLGGGRIDDWFLTDFERGNPGSDLSAWTEGNDVRPLVHGRPYLGALQDAVDAAGAGDLVLATGWRTDPDQRLGGRGSGDVLMAAARRGVLVRALLWRSHSALIGYFAPTHGRLAGQLADVGARALLDHRVRSFGSHHQKSAVVRYAGSPSKDVAFVGGIDVAVSRRDDATHGGDPFARDFADVYGPTPAWHDVRVAVRGPAVADVERSLRERWDDRRPLVLAPWRVAIDSWRGAPRRADDLPVAAPAPPVAGTSAVQVLRTYSRLYPGQAFAPAGERSVARAYAKALARAQRLVYVEDQYLWSDDVAQVFSAALHRAPNLRLIAVVPRFPDQESPIRVPSARLGQNRAMDLVRDVGGDRVQVMDLVRADDTPIYVHAKLCIVDDVWAMVGSANLNRRSWTHDSELGAAVLDDARDTREPADPGGLGDGARRFARELRLELMREHLGRAPGEDADLVDPDSAADAVRSAAEALDRWHDGGGDGPRPPGRLRAHEAGPAPSRLVGWATSAFYDAAFDPDGRPLGMQLRRTF